MVIPKIIHQTAPSNKDEWHPIWDKCHSSWKFNFPERIYSHLMWNDDDMDAFVESEYPQYWELYKNLCLHILQIDFFRYLVLYKYGGIYADMDMYCYTNFYSDLSKDCCLVESSSSDKEEIVQNSLMVSSPENMFYLECIEKFALNYSAQSMPSDYIDRQKWVKETSGPILLSNVYDSFEKNHIQLLPSNEYNPLSYFINTKTKHMLTGRWGKEIMDGLKEYHSTNPELKNLTHKEFLIMDYKQFRGIDSNNFNPYT